MNSSSNRLQQSAGSGNECLGVSVAWSYAFAVLLLLFIFVILAPERNGPSPWDAEAVRASTLELFANFRILDDLADLGVVKVADVGEGFVDVDLDLMVVSGRRFGWGPFYLAVLFVSLALLLRGLRQRVLARHFGVHPSVKGQMSSYFFGRGLNLFFPFGPGELGTVQWLTDGGASSRAATRVVFHNRLFEVLAILLVVGGGSLYLGWEGAVLPVLWTLLLVAGIVSLTRPLGASGSEGGRFNLLAHLWSVFNGPALVSASRQLVETPGFMIGLSLLSILTLELEVAGYWCLKQAFSSAMDDYWLMRGFGFIPFMMVIAVANIARVLPYTFASFGIYEIVSVAMFRVFGIQNFLAGATVSLLDSLLINGLTLIGFVVVLWLGTCPSVLETWRAFFNHSLAQTRVEAS